MLQRLVLVLLLGCAAPARAQVTVSPATVEVSLPAGQQAEVALTVAKAGTDTLGFALSLAPAPTADDPPEEPGTLLFTTEEWDYGLDGLTILPSGNVLAADTWRDFFEFTSELTFIREFEHYYEDFFSGTLGITYNEDTESLWWMDVLYDCTGAMCTIEQALLIEGDFDGNATGRTLEVPWVEDGTCQSTTGLPSDAVYAADATCFFWLDVWNESLWAMDTTGAVVEGYPVPLSDYAGVPQPYNPEGCLVISRLDAHALGGEPVLETVTGYPFVHPRNRTYTVVVLDRWGRNRGAETPLFDLPTPDGFGVVRRVGDVVRSRLDPSVLYLTVRTGKGGASNRYWVYAVRAVPLPPVWLHAEPILFEVEGESETELVLTLDASGLEPGVYEGLASVREGDGIGPVVAGVPVTLTVTEGTDAEDEADVPEVSSLSVYPNPMVGEAVVALSLAEASEVRIAVYDVLGRRVAVLHDGPLAAGTHELRFDGAGLPAGVYLVRTEGGERRLTEQITLVR